MTKSADRAPRGTNVIYKAVTEALAGYPAENHKAIAKAAWEKLKGTLPSAARGRPPSRKAAAKRRAAPRTRRITKSSETANSVAA